MNHQRYFIHLAFNGKNYKGWQLQKNGISVQSVLNHSLSTVLRMEINVTGCGRTDAGVHAENFYAHFDTLSSFTSVKARSIITRLNGFLPHDIVIYNILPVTPEANARFSALSRTYEYRISRQKNPFGMDFNYEFLGPLDIEVMNRAAKFLPEFTDFTSFAKLHAQTKTNICNISEAVWNQTGNTMTFRITADRFLRNMVRSITGTLINAGRGKLSPDDFRNIIQRKDRSKAGTSLPAKGLYLTDVKYPEDIFI